ncbi:MAG: hypothetical protein GY719_41905 [bacterium]|nr:hypothetical protein [bacterium]
MSELIPLASIEESILLLRRQRVMLDMDLARLYGIQTKVLVQAVKRNRDRFPGDFMFQLTKEELEDWRSQIVTSNPAAKMGLRRRPYAFTEHGVLMLSSVLRSRRAVQVNIEIMRAFLRLRRLVTGQPEIVARLDELERRYDARFRAVFEAIRLLMVEPERGRREIGFGAGEQGPGRGVRLPMHQYRCLRSGAHSVGGGGGEAAGEGVAGSGGEQRAARTGRISRGVHLMGTTLEFTVPNALLEMGLEPAEIQRRALEWLALSLFTRERISSGKAACLLGIHRSDILALLRQYGMAFVGTGLAKKV